MSKNKPNIQPKKEDNKPNKPAANKPNIQPKKEDNKPNKPADNKPNIQPKKEDNKPNKPAQNKPTIQPIVKPILQPIVPSTKQNQKEENKPKANNKSNTTTITVGGVKYEVKGNKAGAKELEAIATGSGRSLADLKDKLEDKGIKLADSGKQYYQTNKDTLNQVTSGTGEAEAGGVTNNDEANGGGLFAWEQISKTELEKADLQGGFGLESDRIRAKSAEEIAKIQRDASNYGYDRTLEGTKYATDSEERWRTAVATIEGDKKARLQEIINAGLRDVADIEGSYSLKNVEKKGEWDYKTMGLRTEADKDIARMDANQKMYNLLGIAFG
jgi:hypothetical protein